MAYSIRPHRSFARHFSKLTRADQKRFAEKLDHLTQSPEAIGSPMGNLPPDLRGLHKTRIGGWRLFFWVDREKQEIVPYDIDKRDKAYKHLYRR